MSKSRWILDGDAGDVVNIIGAVFGASDLKSLPSQIRWDWTRL
jgi:hypothetical protein